MPAHRTVYKTCTICEAACGLVVEVEQQRVSSIRPDPNDPLSRGHICPKAFALQEIQEDPDRLQQPVRRKGDGWESISWEQALEEVAEQLTRIQREHGNDAVGSYVGNPTVHNLGCALAVTLLSGAALQSHNRFSAASLDQNPKHASSYLLFGNILSIPVPDLDRSDFLLIIGANPAVSGGSLMTAPGIRKRIRAIQERGGQVIVVDPRRSETAELADRHLPIRPRNDAYLLSAMLHVVFEEKLILENHVHAHLLGIDALQRSVAPFSPERVSEQTGIEAEQIRLLTREFAAAPSAVCYGRVGTCLQPYGTLNSWLVDALNILTGNLDRPGGAMFTSPAADPLTLSKGRHSPFNPWKSRVRGAPSFNSELPAACLAEEILTPGEGQIRGMLFIAGNPALSSPNGGQLDRAFESLEFSAAVDFYINETTRHANVILPPTWSLEDENYELFFHLLAVRNTAKYSPRVLDPGPDTRSDWEILSDLFLRMQAKKETNPLRSGGIELLRRSGLLPGPRRLLDWMLRMGPRGDRFLPHRRGLRVAELERTPSGVDLGALEPCLDRVLQSKSGNIDLASPPIHSQLVRLREELERREPGAQPLDRPRTRDDLLLIGRRDLRTNNSWLHNAPLSVKGRNRCTLKMNPADANRLSLKAGQSVGIRSRVATLEAPLEISDELMPGVVSLPHGWGHDKPGMRLRNAQAHPGVNLNALMDDQELEGVVGNAVLNGIPVEVFPASSSAD